jgi:dTDP-4-amino-4,6-dideoxygalactose transaminase
MLITDDDDLADRIERGRAHGFIQGGGIEGSRKHYDASSLGGSYRMNELHAAIGSTQLDRLPAFVQKRQENHSALARGLVAVEGLGLFEAPEGEIQTGLYCFTVILPQPLWPKRLAMIEALGQLGVRARVFYPRTVPELSFYRGRAVGAPEFPNATAIAKGTLAFPVGPHLNLADMRSIESATKRVMKRARA